MLMLYRYCVRRYELFIYLPVQLSPSPKYPGRQAQVKLPGVLVQLASALQPPLFSAHSSISEPSKTSACHQRDNCGTIRPMYIRNCDFTRKILSSIPCSLQERIQGFALGGRTHSPSRPVLFPPFQSPPVLLRSRALKLVRGSPHITNYILQIFSWFWEWNICENRLIFDDEVKAYKNCAIFGPPCTSCWCYIVFDVANYSFIYLHSWVHLRHIQVDKHRWSCLAC